MEYELRVEVPEVLTGSPRRLLNELVKLYGTNADAVEVAELEPSTLAYGVAVLVVVLVVMGVGLGWELEIFSELLRKRRSDALPAVVEAAAVVSGVRYE